MPDEQPHPPARSIASAVLEDGALVEMLHRPEKKETTLLVFRDGQTAEHPYLDPPEGGRVRPYAAENNLVAHRVILFPSAAAEYRSEDALLADVRAFIHRYADLSEGFEEIASYYILLSWVYDAFFELPYLRLKGDYGSGKSRCLQTIGSLTCKPIFASGASTTSPLFRILDAFRGTLVLDESDFRFSDEKAEIVKILNNGNASGFPVLRSEATPQKEFNPRAFHVFGPKIIATRRDFEDRALESRCITEVMTGLPPRRDIPLNLPKSFHAEARDLRNQLLMYRFRTFDRPRDLEAVRDDRVEARVAQVFAPLLSIADSDARERIRSFARGSSGTLRAERSQSLEAQLVGIMDELRKEKIALGVKEIAERFALRHGEDFSRPITARWIGGQLRKRLSLVAIKSHSSFVVPETEYKKLDVLAERYGVHDGDGDVGMSGISPEAATLGDW